MHIFKLITCSSSSFNTFFWEWSADCFSESAQQTVFLRVRSWLFLSESAQLTVFLRVLSRLFFWRCSPDFFSESAPLTRLSGGINENPSIINQSWGRMGGGREEGGGRAHWTSNILTLPINHSLTFFSFTRILFNLK